MIKNVQIGLRSSLPSQTIYQNYFFWRIWRGQKITWYMAEVGQRVPGISIGPSRETGKEKKKEDPWNGVKIISYNRPLKPSTGEWRMNEIKLALFTRGSGAEVVPRTGQMGRWRVHWIRRENQYMYNNLHTGSRPGAIFFFDGCFYSRERLALGVRMALYPVASFLFNFGFHFIPSPSQKSAINLESE
jgi:hypothetical protein